ncbi:LysR family transcriptional regulator [Paenibacillus mesophilus]|uniref:LysR substrate-binding domain-containing protein n=1 Tax=Paenibacillus mesophilus TaxID=2582849 RepID=UPI00110E29AB|nr:LysR substrate-binding domain-containing protein [Paenibacillus mesophilus]TMV52851.1 LysR family transcriptional regulator [Paenibacillus mesophilus]
MELRYLEYFMTMCQELHFTRASEKLGISQPTLSQQIRALEQETDTLLFDRVGKKVVVTEAGKILYRHCVRMFDELGQAQSAIRELKGLQRGEIRIGCSGNHMLINSVISFHQLYPGIQISVAELSTEETRQGLLDNRLDLGVVFLPVEGEQLESIPLYTEKLSLAVPYHHPLAEATEIELDRLKQMPMALLPPKFLVRQLVDRATKSKGFRFQPVLEMTTLDSLMELVFRNIALTILPDTYLTGTDPKRTRRITIVDPTPQRVVGIVYRNDMFISSATKVFIEYLKQTFRIPEEVRL